MRELAGAGPRYFCRRIANGLDGEGAEKQTARGVWKGDVQSGAVGIEPTTLNLA